MRKIFAVMVLISLCTVLSHADVYTLSLTSATSWAFDNTNVHQTLTGGMAMPLVMPVPEPDTILLLVTMLAGVGLSVRMLRLSKGAGLR
jgi:hypothetical protein